MENRNNNHYENPVKTHSRIVINTGVPDRTTRGPTSTFATRSRVAKVDVGPRVVRSAIFNQYFSGSRVASQSQAIT